MVATAVTSTSALELDDMQGLILRGYRRLRAACFLLYTVDEPAAACAFLAEMAPQLTTAATPTTADTALNLALTVPGLVRLGLPAAAVATFPPELRDGIAAASSATWATTRLSSGASAARRHRRCTSCCCCTRPTPPCLQRWSTMSQRRRRTVGLPSSSGSTPPTSDRRSTLDSVTASHSHGWRASEAPAMPTTMPSVPGSSSSATGTNMGSTRFVHS